MQTIQSSAPSQLEISCKNHKLRIFTGLNPGQAVRNLHQLSMVGLAMLAVLPIPGQYYITRYCSYSFWSEASFCKYQHWLLAFPASLKAAFFISQNPRKISFLQLPTISQHSINKTNNSSRYFSFTFFQKICVKCCWGKVEDWAVFTAVQHSSGSLIIKCL